MEYFSSKNVKNVKQKSNQKKKNKSKSKKKLKKMQKQKQKMQQKNKSKKQAKKTKAKAKGTHKKQNFKSQSVFGCKSKYLTSCKQIFKLPAASKKNMEQKLIPSILTMIMM
jgi:uncharacterized protein (DUF3084 family)